MLRRVCGAPWPVEGAPCPSRPLMRDGGARGGNGGGPGGARLAAGSPTAAGAVTPVRAVSHGGMEKEGRRASRLSLRLREGARAAGSPRLLRPIVSSPPAFLLLPSWEGLYGAQGPTQTLRLEGTARGPQGSLKPAGSRRAAFAVSTGFRTWKSIRYHLMVNSQRRGPAFHSMLRGKEKKKTNN